jgi:hypothetical protein
MDHRNKSRQEIEQEKFQWAMKSFDIAETPIKQWLAEYIGQAPDTMFDDYVDEHDIISTEFKSKYYSFWLSPYPDRDESGQLKSFNIDKDMIDKDNKIGESLSRMFDAVRQVFMPVVQSMEHEKYKIKNMMPVFEEDTMSFYLCQLNEAYLKRSQALQGLATVTQYRNKLDELNEETKEKVLKEIETINANSLELLNQTSEEDVKKEEALCKKFNDEQKKSGPRLYICCSQEYIPDEDMIFKRMPKLDIKYRDADDDSLIQQLKQEYDA